MNDPLDREALLREMHRLFRQIGYPGYRSRHFNEAHAIKQWPDPATRERRLRACWDSQVEEAYPSYREQYAHVSTEGLAECRDYLRAKLSEPGLDPDTYARRLGHRARYQRRAADPSQER